MSQYEFKPGHKMKFDTMIAGLRMLYGHGVALTSSLLHGRRHIREHQFAYSDIRITLKEFKSGRVVVFVAPADEKINAVISAWRSGK